MTPFFVECLEWEALVVGWLEKRETDAPRRAHRGAQKIVSRCLSQLAMVRMPATATDAPGRSTPNFWPNHRSGFFFLTDNENEKRPHNNQVLHKKLLLLLLLE